MSEDRSTSNANVDLAYSEFLGLLARLLEGPAEEVPVQQTLDQVRDAMLAAGYTEVPSIPVRVVELRRSLVKESDRGCALAGVAYLDHSLELSLRAHMVDVDAVADQLFGASGPLGTLSARIDLAFALGIIGKAIHRDLHLLRKIRNHFAHEPGDVGFDSPEIAGRCAVLHHDLFQEKLSPRRAFLRVLLGVLGYIEGATLSASRPAVGHDVDLAAHAPVAALRDQVFCTDGRGTRVPTTGTTNAATGLEGCR